LQLHGFLVYNLPKKTNGDKQQAKNIRSKVHQKHCRTRA